jgi:hypothetical protein
MGEQVTCPVDECGGATFYQPVEGLNKGELIPVDGPGRDLIFEGDTWIVLGVVFSNI